MSTASEAVTRNAARAPRCSDTTSVPPALSAGDDPDRAPCGDEGQQARVWSSPRGRWEDTQMASDDNNNIFGSGTAPEAPADTAAPVKKAAAKRAPRKATKKASAPQPTSDGAAGGVTAAAPDASGATTDAS